MMASEKPPLVTTWDSKKVLQIAPWQSKIILVQMNNVGFDLKAQNCGIDLKLRKRLVGRVSKLHPTIKFDMRCSWDVSLSWGKSSTLPSFTVTIGTVSIGRRGTPTRIGVACPTHHCPGRVG